MSPPQAAETKKVMRPPSRMSAVIKTKWEAPISGKYRQAKSAVPKLASTSQVLRRNLMSTTGAKRKPMTPGRLMIEPMLAILSTGTPARESSNGNAVKLKPTTTIPRGRISRLKSQGAGGLRESRMGSDHSSLSAHIVGELLSHMRPPFRSSQAVIINAPLEAVWAFSVDITKIPEFHPRVVKVDLLSGKALREAGVSYQCYLSGEKH